MDGLVIYSNDINVNIIPSDYILYQNYPNPFNPSTVIKYAVPFESNVVINFYNSLGENVREVNVGTRQPGYYDIKFQCSWISNRGIHLFYKSYINRRQE